MKPIAASMADGPTAIGRSTRMARLWTHTLASDATPLRRGLSSDVRSPGQALRRSSSSLTGRGVTRLHTGGRVESRALVLLVLEQRPRARSRPPQATAAPHARIEGVQCPGDRPWRWQYISCENFMLLP